MILMTAAALAVPIAATAQPVEPPVVVWDADAFWRGAPTPAWERIAFLQQRIDNGVADHSLNRREAIHAQEDLRHIRQLATQMRARDGGTLNDTDNAYIQQRLDTLSRQIHWMRHNW
ncbi:MAG: hypothetical protein JF593_01885 [Novosphingobium sp.]|nr:hypothetical protein [Novosphingobium sp.]